MSRDIVPLGLRMPPDLKEQIESASKQNGRSMNAEIVARLQASFSGKSEDGVFMIAEDLAKQYGKEHEINWKEALDILVLKGASRKDCPVAYLSTHPNMTVSEMSAALRLLGEATSDDASIGLKARIMKAGKSDD